MKIKIKENHSIYIVFYKPHSSSLINWHSLRSIYSIDIKSFPFNFNLFWCISLYIQRILQMIFYNSINIGPHHVISLPLILWPETSSKWWLWRYIIFECIHLWWLILMFSMIIMATIIQSIVMIVVVIVSDPGLWLW